MKIRSQFLMMRARGLAGPFFHPWAPKNAPLVRGTGNFIGSIGVNGVRVTGGLSASSTEGTNPSALTIIVSATDDDGNDLAWTLAESITWASFSPASGTGTTEVTVTLDPVGAATAPGVYAEDFTITAAGASNSPYTRTLTLTYYATPIIARSPTSLDFGSEFEGEATTSTLTFTVSNSASPAGPMPFVISDDAAWISTTTNGNIVSVTVDWSLMSVGANNGTVTITAATASNSPQTVSVAATVEQRATISLSQSTLAFTAEVDAADPADQTFDISNTGGVDLLFTISDNAAWLSVDTTSGTVVNGTPETITVSVANTGLTEGTYNATITVSDSEATNSPQTISVSHEVTAVASAWDYEDDFTSDDLGWTIVDGYTSYNISGGEMQLVGGGIYGRIYHATGTGLAADQEVQWEFNTPFAITTYFGFMLRYNTADGTGIRIFFPSNPQECRIGNAIGANTGNVTVTTVSAPAADWLTTSASRVLRARVVGTSIEIYIDEVLSYTATIDINTTLANAAVGYCGEGRDRLWDAIRAKSVV